MPTHGMITRKRIQRRFRKPRRLTTLGVVGLACALTFGVPLLSGLLTSCKQSEKHAPNLIVLQTGRLRGNVLPIESSGRGAIPYFAYISGYVKQVREEARMMGADVLLVDLGDSMDGSFTSYMTGTANMAEFFNALDYDAVVLGNLDSSVTSEALARLKMPVLCPFVDDQERSPIPDARIGTTINKPLVGQIALVANFFGEVDPSSQPAQFPNSFGGVSPIKPFRNYERLDVQVPGWKDADLRLATWMKFEPQQLETNAFAEKLAQERADLALAHRIYDRKHAEGWQLERLDAMPLPITMNILRHNSGFLLARTDLVRSGSGWKVLDAKLVPMTANLAPLDESLMSRIENLFGDMMTKADATLATLDRDLTREDLLDWAHGALARVATNRADATLYSLASIRIQIKAGLLRLGDLYDALPWSDPVVIIALPASEAVELAKARELDLRISESQATTSKGMLRIATTRFFANMLDEHATHGSQHLPILAEGRPIFQLIAEGLPDGVLPGILREESAQ